MDGEHSRRFGGAQARPHSDFPGVFHGTRFGAWNSHPVHGRLRARNQTGLGRGGGGRR